MFVNKASSNENGRKSLQSISNMRQSRHSGNRRKKFTARKNKYYNYSQMSSSGIEKRQRRRRCRNAFFYLILNYSGGIFLVGFGLCSMLMLAGCLVLISSPSFVEVVTDDDDGIKEVDVEGGMLRGPLVHVSDENPNEASNNHDDVGKVMDLIGNDDELIENSPTLSFEKKDFLFLTTGNLPSYVSKDMSARGLEFSDTVQSQHDFGREFTVSLFVYLEVDELNDSRRSRTILSNKSTPSQSLMCDSIPSYVRSSGIHKLHGGGYRLFVNSPHTADETLCFDYIWKNDDGAIVCSRVMAVGYPILSKKWFHVALSVNENSISIFINGNNVITESLKGSPLLESGKKLRIGMNHDEGLPLHGYVGMLTLFPRTSVDTINIKNWYQLGANLHQSNAHLQHFNGLLLPLLRPLSSSDFTKSGVHTVLSQEKEIAVETNNEQSDSTYSTFSCVGLKNDMYYNKYVDGAMDYNIDFETGANNDEIARFRREAIKQAMKHAWDGYKQYAFGFDELLPVSLDSQNNWGGFAVTLVDALDTLWLMGMKDEFIEGRRYIAESLNFENVQEKVSVFETTIRVLGGLLSAYQMSKDRIFLSKADDLGSRLLPAFQTASGLPNEFLPLNKLEGMRISGRMKFGLADIGTLLLEFRYLSQLTGNQTYREKVDHVFRQIEAIHPPDGLFPNRLEGVGVHVKIPLHGLYNINIGGGGDSFYEYLLKAWLMSKRTENKLREMYDLAVDGIHKRMLFVTKPNGLRYIAKLTKFRDKVKVVHEMDHLTCFMGGTLALGAYTDPNGIKSARAQRDLSTAKALAYTCYQMYAQMTSGLSPEVAVFHTEGSVEGIWKSQKGSTECDLRAHDSKSFYSLRPEVLESLYVLYTLTKDSVYRDWGWEIFKAIETNCRTMFAYGAYKDVTTVGLNAEDKLESFFFAETLKYAYLLHDPDTNIDILKDYVFNTEAHLFPL